MGMLLAKNNEVVAGWYHISPSMAETRPERPYLLDLATIEEPMIQDHNIQLKYFHSYQFLYLFLIFTRIVFENGKNGVPRHDINTIKLNVSL